jgi:hypothetical protein
MAKIKCRPVRSGKPGPKTVRVKPYTRSKPKRIGKRC